MESRKNLKGAGAGFLGVGIAFLAITLSTDRTAFMGVAMAFIALGLVFLGASRKDR